MKKSYVEFVCDQCGKKNIEKNTDHTRISPHGWYRVEITKIRGFIGTRIYHKDLCSSVCVMKTLGELKKVPRMRIEKRRMICHS